MVGIDAEAQPGLWRVWQGGERARSMLSVKSRSDFFSDAKVMTGKSKFGSACAFVEMAPCRDSRLIYLYETTAYI